MPTCPPLPRPHPHSPPRPHLPQRVPFAQKFPEADPLAIDLLERLLQFDPNRRLTVHEALKHPWLAQLHDEAAEPAADGAHGGRRDLGPWQGFCPG